MNKSDFYYLSADEKTIIHGTVWTPAHEPVRAVLQIAHGITEYIGRYEAVAEYFTQCGFAVMGNDHLGHGLSVQDEDHRMYFGKAGSWNYAVQDLRTCRRVAEQYYGNVPCCLLGFSLGSFLVRSYLTRFPNTVDAAILMGTGMEKPMSLTIGKLMAQLEGFRAGENKATPLIQKMMFEGYNKGFQPARTPMDWLTSDDTALDAYLSDPMCSHGVTCGLFRELLSGMISTCSEDAFAQTDKSVPLLLISGEADPVGRNGKGLRELQRVYKDAGCPDVQLELYHGRHDILRDYCSKDVMNYIHIWMQDKLNIC